MEVSARERGRTKATAGTSVNPAFWPMAGKTSAVNILTRLDDSTCTLQSVNRTVDGELLPNIDEVKITKEELHHE
jgi:hypothetical protein